MKTLILHSLLASLAWTAAAEAQRFVSVRISGGVASLVIMEISGGRLIHRQGPTLQVIVDPDATSLAFHNGKLYMVSVHPLGFTSMRSVPVPGRSRVSRTSQA